MKTEIQLQNLFRGLILIFFIWWASFSPSLWAQREEKVEKKTPPRTALCPGILPPLCQPGTILWGGPGYIVYCDPRICQPRLWDCTSLGLFPCTTLSLQCQEFCDPNHSLACVSCELSQVDCTIGGSPWPERCNPTDPGTCPGGLACVGIPQIGFCCIPRPQCHCPKIEPDDCCGQLEGTGGPGTLVEYERCAVRAGCHWEFNRGQSTCVTTRSCEQKAEAACPQVWQLTGQGGQPCDARFCPPCGNGVIDPDEECDWNFVGPLQPGSPGVCPAGIVCNQQCKCEQLVTCTPNVTLQCDAEIGICQIGICCAPQAGAGDV